MYETQTELTEAREELELMKLKLEVADQEAQAAKRQAAEATAATAALLQAHDSPGLLSPINRRSLSREVGSMLPPSVKDGSIHTFSLLVLKQRQGRDTRKVHILSKSASTSLTAQAVAWLELVECARLQAEAIEMLCQQAVNGKQAVSFMCLVQDGFAGFLSLHHAVSPAAAAALLALDSFKPHMHGCLCADIYFPQPQFPFLVCLVI